VDMTRPPGEVTAQIGDATTLACGQVRVNENLLIGGGLREFLSSYLPAAR